LGVVPSVGAANPAIPVVARVVDGEVDTRGEGAADDPGEWVVASSVSGMRACEDPELAGDLRPADGARSEDAGSDEDAVFPR
jgi:hypothetical protein